MDMMNKTYSVVFSLLLSFYVLGDALQNLNKEEKEQHKANKYYYDNEDGLEMKTKTNENNNNQCDLTARTTTATASEATTTMVVMIKQET